MNKLIICILGLMFSVNLYSKSEFVDFLDKFPVVSWCQLDSIIQENWKDKQLESQIQLPEANRNIWYDRDLGKSHVNRKKGDLLPPHIRLENGTYMTMDYCGYYLKGSISPICKCYINSNIVMLVLLYKFYDDEILQYRYNIDAYTFDLKDEQMCSAICLYNYPHIDSDLSPVYRAYVDLNQDITCLKYTTSEDAPDELFVFKYHLADDGYLDGINLYKSDFVHAKIEDADGYVNLRESPNSKSKIITTINSGTYVVLEPIKNSNWYKVRNYYSGKNSNTLYRHGYVYKDKVKIISLFPDKHQFSIDGDD